MDVSSIQDGLFSQNAFVFMFGNTFLVFFALLIVYLILYLISRYLQSERLKLFVWSEVLDTTATVLLVVFLAVILSSSENFVVDTFFSGVHTPCGEVQGINDMYSVMSCRVSAYAYTLYQIQESAVSIGGAYIEKLGTYFYLLDLPVYQGPYFTDLYYGAEQSRLIVTMSSSLLIYMNALSFGLKYLSANLLPVFLPLGIVLRLFRFTKGIGAFFISPAFVFYFVFPAVYLVVDSGAIPSVPSVSGHSVDQSCYPTMDVVFATGEQSQSLPEHEIDISTLKQDFSSIYSKILISPFVAFSISLVFLKYMTSLFGGDVSVLMRFVYRLV